MLNIFVFKIYCRLQKTSAEVFQEIRGSGENLVPIENDLEKIFDEVGQISPFSQST